MSAVEVRIGDVWIDLDPRGGPTFMVVAIDGRYAEVTDLRGKRPRRILLERFRGSANYRSGYALLNREPS